jgi:uncharacterized protein (TIGR00661 family)
VRDIPLIRLLLENQYEVIVGADGLPAEFLKTEFPELRFVKFRSFPIKYSKKLPFGIKIILQTPKIFFGIFNEHRILKKICFEIQPDLIISDNRYGAYAEEIASILITHQLFPKLPKFLAFAETFFARRLHKFIERFDLCMIPDAKDGPNISGSLSHGFELKFKTLFVGPISRFENQISKTNGNYDLAVILSGPEPQRTILENIILAQISETELRAIVVGGKSGNSEIRKIGNIDYADRLSSKETENLIFQTPVIIARAGYTSIMDFIKLKKSAILIPTPGQSEQEYLAQYLEKSGLFQTYKQNEINLSKAIKVFLNFKPKFVNLAFRQELFLNEIKKLIL